MREIARPLRQSDDRSGQRPENRERDSELEADDAAHERRIFAHEGAWLHGSPPHAERLRAGRQVSRRHHAIRYQDDRRARNEILIQAAGDFSMNIVAKQTDPVEFTCADKVELEARCQLAACYRMFGRRNMDDMIYTHLSARIPGRDGRFLFIPFGMLFEEVTASNLMEVDIEG